MLFSVVAVALFVVALLQGAGGKPGAHGGPGKQGAPVSLSTIIII
jgi:hypothetical protein